MTSHDHDLTFLQELAKRLDEEPRAKVTGRDLAKTADVDKATAEQVIARLRRLDLIERREAPTRVGLGVLDMPLEITRAGWTAAADGRL